MKKILIKKKERKEFKKKKCKKNLIIKDLKKKVD